MDINGHPSNDIARYPMKNIKIGCLTLGMSALLLHLTGCGGPSDQPDLGQVTGTITLDGDPLPRTSVMFQPENGRPATGITDEEGHYELTYIRETKGTKIGKNLVQIGGIEESEDEEDAVAFDADGEPITQASAQPIIKPKIPVKYNLRSELEVDVQPGENTFDFDLES